MPLDPGQIRVNDLVMGRGTPYTVRGFNPWSRPVKGGQSGTVPFGHGRWAGAQFRDAVKVPMTILIMAPDPADWVAYHDNVAAAFDAIGTDATEHELEWNLHGHERIMFGRAEGLDSDPHRAGVGISIEATQFTALDGFMYSAVEHVAEIGVYRTVSGVTVPMTIPAVVYSVPADGIVVLTNAGKAPAALDLTIPGPVVDPAITVTADGGEPRTLFLDIVLDATDVLTVNTGTQDVRLNGDVSRLWSAYGSWPLLAPGTDSTVEYRAAAETSSRLTIRFRDTY
jgi:hypothetical protein